jgi:hypothetical protein
LPKLSLAKFKGEVTKWNTFWDSFESAIHTNNDISKIDKFNYFNSLLEGIALRAIQGLTLTGANYDAAIEILRDRFGQPQQIITAHMDELLKIPASTGDKLSSLRFIYDKISVHVRALASLGVSSDQYGSLLIPIILSKMPGDIRLQIARQTKKDAWKIDDLLQIIKFEIESSRTRILLDPPETGNPTITATRLSKGTVLLQTARAIATSNGKSAPVRVLFDAGSQRSYVSNAVLQRLDVKPVKREVLHVNTFGENSYKRQNCGVYKLSLENNRTRDGVEIQAVNFPVICSPLRLIVTTNYAHLDGLDLADFNHEESDDSIDVLVGADHY